MFRTLTGLQEWRAVCYDFLGEKSGAKEKAEMNKRRQGRRPFSTYAEENPTDSNKQFDQFEASSLFCPKCKRAVPVRKRLLLVLPEGERYEYLCAICSESIGRKVEEVKKKIQLIHTR